MSSTQQVQPVLPDATIPRISRRGRPSKYPWDQLAVSVCSPDGTFAGPWFFVPGKRHARFASSCTEASKRFAKKFVCRDVDGGVGVWRIE